MRRITGKRQGQRLLAQKDLVHCSNVILKTITPSRTSSPALHVGCGHGMSEVSRSLTYKTTYGIMLRMTRASFRWCGLRRVASNISSRNRVVRDRLLRVQQYQVRNFLEGRIATKKMVFFTMFINQRKRMLYAKHPFASLHHLHKQLFGLVSTAFIAIRQRQVGHLVSVKGCSAPNTFLLVFITCTPSSSAWSCQP